MGTGAMQSLRYQQVEIALVRMHNIRDKDLKRFRARLRNLRNLGVPDLPKVGSGKQIAYTQDHLEELSLAVELMKFGLSPSHIASFLKRQTGRQKIRIWREESLNSPRSEYHLGFQTRMFGGELGEHLASAVYFWPKRELLKALSGGKEASTERGFFLIDYSSRLRKLHGIMRELRSATSE